jgi:hypothetical protein
MSRIFRCHSKLNATLDGPTIKKQPLHLKQSDLDGACGPHCAVMALMLLGAVTRQEVESPGDIKYSSNKSLAQMWKRTRSFYFVGTAPRQLQSVLQPFKSSIKSRFLSKNKRIEKLIETLGSNGTCIVGITTESMGHWVLAVGVSSASEYDKPDTLLMLDPDAPTMPLTPWNATLSVKANVRGMHRYESSSISTKVFVGSVLALTPCIDRDLLNLDSDLDLELELDLK